MRHETPTRRRRRRCAPRLRDLAVLAYPSRDDGATLLFGPFTRNGALAVALRELLSGLKVQLVPFERVRALAAPAVQR